MLWRRPAAPTATSRNARFPHAVQSVAAGFGVGIVSDRPRFGVPRSGVPLTIPLFAVWQSRPLRGVESAGNWRTGSATSHGFTLGNGY